MRWLLSLSVLLLPTFACDCDDDPDTPVDAGGGGDGPLDTGLPDGGPVACVTAGTIEGDTTGIDYPDGITGNGDLAVENGLIRAVFSAIERVPVTSASGGVLTDLHFLGESDHWNEMWQLGGASQLLMVQYTELGISEQSDDRVVVRASGHVAPRPRGDGTLPLSPDPGTNLAMVTTYEFRCDDPRVRVRSELENATTSTYVIQAGFQPMDVIVWGQKSLEPFCPNAGQGYECTQFDIDNPLATIVRSRYFGTTGSLTGDVATFGFYSDVAEEFNGLHNSQLSTVGVFETSIGTFMPGQVKSWQRVIVAGRGADPAAALDVVLEDLETLGRIETATISGTVTLTGETLSSNPYERPVVVLAEAPASGSDTDPTTWIPRTAVRVAADGTFTARVPAGTYSYEVRAVGRERLRASGGAAAAGATLELGTITVPEAPLLTVEVVDAAGAGVPSRVHVVGADGTETPSFGSPWGASPAANLALTDGDGMVSLRLPAGTYDVYAVHGIGWSMGYERVTVDATGASVSLTIEELEVFPDGFLTGDFHVHSATSFDSSLPSEDRVRSYLAEGVDVVVSTEHDVIYDYAPALAAVEAGLPPSWQGRVRTFVGIESTQFVPWESFPHTIGHNNAFPVTPTEGAWKNGAPLDEYIDPATLYERLRALPTPATAPLIQLNHGRAGRSGQIWLGYFDSCGFDPTAAFDPDGPCWSWTGPMGTRPWDMDAIEVINGHDLRWVNNRRDWYALLLNGHMPVGTGNSDSHSLANDSYAGYPVTVFRSEGTLAELDDAGLVSALESGAVAGAMGVFVWFEVASVDGTTRGVPGQTVAIPAAANVEIRVAAPPWVPVEEIRVLVGGEVVTRLAAGTDFTNPAEPFGTAGVVRYEDTVSVALPATEDTFITVEAGVALPPLGDVNGDGVADATDNDGDGDIDADDVAAGGIVLTAVPTHFGFASGGAQPIGFANPVFIDTDAVADGWQAPMRPLVD